MGLMLSSRLVTMAKRKSHRKAKFTIPIAVAAPALAMGYDIVSKAMAGNVAGLKGTYTGVWENGQFNASQVIATYAPLAAGVIIHKGASFFGANKAIAQSRIPIFRI